MISWGQGQGCQIALGKTDTNVKNIPNDHTEYTKIITEYTKLTVNILNYHNIPNT
jgi:hypothetical protein